MSLAMSFDMRPMSRAMMKIQTTGGHVVDDVARCAHDIGSDMESAQQHVVNDVARHEAHVENNFEPLVAMSLTISPDAFTISVAI